MNAEFQRITRRHKKSVLSDQSKEIEEKLNGKNKLEISRKLERPKGNLHKDGDDKGQKQYGPNRSRRY